MADARQNIKNTGHKLKMVSRDWGKMKGEPVVREATVIWGTLFSMYGMFSYDSYTGLLLKGYSTED